jgi:NADH-quinone oxidoreductase subunit N
MDNLESIRFFYPELILTSTLLVVIILGLVVRGAKRRALLTVVSLIGLILAFFYAFSMFHIRGFTLFSGMIALDPFAIFFKLLAIGVTGLVICFAYPTWEIDQRSSAEYISLLIVALLGISLLASSINLLMIYLAFEMVSIPSYLLSGLKKRDVRSNEAALKYVIYGAVSTGLMLYGLSLLYGMTGTLDIIGINRAIAASNPYPLTLFVAGVLILAGFCYKIAAVPFHFWSPDVYEGAPTPVTAFLSVAPKAAGFSIIIRFFYVALSRGGPDATGVLGGFNWPSILAVMSAVTMTFGNLTAIVQKNLKRLLAYSSIAHAGYMLMGVVVLSSDGLRAVLFYLIVYLFMNLGAFLVVIAVAEATKKEEIQDYAGLGYRSPFAAVAMTVFLFSLTGIPPTGGFVGKFYLFAAVIGKEYYWLAVIGILNSVISLYYYARIIKAMYLSKFEDNSAIRLSPIYTALMGLLVIPTILFGVYWAPVARFVHESLSMFPFL